MTINIYIPKWCCHYPLSSSLEENIPFICVSQMAAVALVRSMPQVFQQVLYLVIKLQGTDIPPFQKLELYQLPLMKDLH